MKPSVSIVVPCYNAENFLAETIHSLLSQDDPDLEIIAINDGSTDGTAQILDGFRDSIRVIHQKNQGQAATLNQGWGLAQGEYLGYLSADDLLEPGAIRTLVEYFTKHPETDIAYPDYQLIDSQSRLLRKVETKTFALRDLVVQMHCPPGPGALFRRRLHAELGGWNPTLRQLPDYDFWLRASRHFKFGRVPQILASFRVHGESQSFSRPSVCKAEEPCAVMSDFIHTGFHPQLVGQSELAMARAHILSSRLHLRAYRFGPAFVHVWRAFQYSPRQALSPSSIRLLLHGLLDPIRFHLRQTLRSP